MADGSQRKMSGTWEPWHRQLLPDPFVPVQSRNTDGKPVHKRENSKQQLDLDEPLLELQKSIQSLEKRLETDGNPEQQACLRKSIEDYKKKYEKLKNEKTAEELAEASKDISCLRQKVERFEEEKSENQKKIEKIEKIEKERVTEVNKLEETVRHLKERLKDQESATDAAQSEVKSLKHETDELKRKNKELEKESKKTAIQSTQRIEEQEKEFMETERQQIEALMRDIEQSRAELKEQEESFKYQLQEKEEEILRVSNQLNEQQAEFEACLGGKEQLQKNYDSDMEKLMVVIKKQNDIESTLRSELKELQDTVPKIEADKRMELDQLTQKINRLKNEYDKIGKEHKEQDEVVAKQKETIEALQATNKKITIDVMKKENELQDTRDHLQKVKDKLAKAMEEKDEVIASLQQAVEERSETVSQMKETASQMKQALDQQMIKANEQLEAKQKQINELVEKLQVEEAQSAIYKHDFETERNDRQELHQSFTDSQAHCQYLKQKLTEEEEKFTDAQGQYHELRQKHAADKEQINEHSKLIASMTDEREKTKGELTKTREQLSSLSKEKKRMEKQIQELEQGETDRVKQMEEEIQVLTAQVNAYSREVDKQKGLVTQSQEKHKTEVIQLKEKLDSEMKFKTTVHRKFVDEKQQLVNKKTELERNLTTELRSKQQQQQLINELNKKLTNETKLKQQLAGELASIRQQLDSKEESYHEERARLEDQIERMKQANVVLMNKLQQQVNTTDPRGIREPQYRYHHLPPNTAVRPNSTPAPAVQSDGDSMLVVSKTEGVTPVLHTDSDSIPDDIRPQMSKEEMARMFKWKDQQGSSSDWMQSPQQVEDSSLAAQKRQPTEDSLLAEQKRQELARKANDALLEVDRMRESQNMNKQNSSPTRMPPPSHHTVSKQEPVHPQQKVNDNQAKQQDDSDSDIEENKLIDNIDEEIQQMAEDVRKGSRGPSTAEVLFDDSDSSLPYDPNLVCPKCGKQYRVGEIQKLRRHINEFCTGMR